VPYGGRDVNFYGTVADFVVFVHVVYMAFVLFGQLAVFVGWPLGWKWIRNPWFRGTHLAMIVFVAIEGVHGYECPLTGWEKDLRKAAGQNFLGTEGDEESGISFTGRMLRQIQFAGNNWEEYINTSFYIAAGVIVASFLLVPPRHMRWVLGVNLLFAAFSATVLAMMTNGLAANRWVLAALLLGYAAGIACLLPWRKAENASVASQSN
jgi:hypothetical protein